MDFISALFYCCCRKIERTRMRAIRESPVKTNDENQTKRRRTEEIQNAVGAGALDSPLYINVFSGRRRRRPLPRFVRERSFVRSRKIVQTRIRTPHPSAFSCHLPPLGKALDKCKQRNGGSKPPPYGVTLYSVHTRDNLFPINSPIHIPVEVCFSISRPNHKPDRTPVEIYFPPANLSNP